MHSVTVQRGMENTDLPLHTCRMCLCFKYSANAAQVVPISLLPLLLEHPQLNSERPE